ncbi:hypothetical protein [Oscillibacter sp.]|uniref:hypothetical protein n=1 Tax=Oscillibacter sp. TaxID=1945593 RepID=UPI00257E324F|nr:hypothetical protein [Oscillibacter sp.]
MEDAKRQTLARIVRAGAEEMLPRQLALLEQICAIDSGTGNEAGNAAVTGLLEPVLSELGARTERVTEPGLGTHLVARVRPEQPRGKVLLAAHLDTVFGPGFAEKHHFHIEGEWAHGLGAGDCKSGVLISLFGALILKKAGLLPPWELTYLSPVTRPAPGPAARSTPGRRRTRLWPWCSRAAGSGTDVPGSSHPAGG